MVAELEDPWRTLVDLDMHVGLRVGEIAGLRRGAVDWQHGLIHVVAVMTRYGPRKYTKGKRLRTVPLPAHLADALLPLVSGDPGGLVFTGAEGGPLQDSNFRNRVFAPALQRARVRRGSPHDMRHTAASWLVMDGVDLYRVQALLGHESFATTMRYAHLAPSAFQAVTDSWSRAAWTPGGHNEKAPTPREEELGL